MWGFVFDDDTEGVVFGKIVQNFVGAPSDNQTARTKSTANPVKVKKTKSVKSTSSTTHGTSKGMSLPSVPSIFKSPGAGASASTPALGNTVTPSRSQTRRAEGVRSSRILQISAPIPIPSSSVGASTTSLDVNSGVKRNPLIRNPASSVSASSLGLQRTTTTLPPSTVGKGSPAPVPRVPVPKTKSPKVKSAAETRRRKTDPHPGQRDHRPRISRSMISLPKISSFVHVSHIGFDKDGGFEWSEGIDPTWMEVLGELEGRRENGRQKSLPRLSSDQRRQYGSFGSVGFAQVETVDRGSDRSTGGRFAGFKKFVGPAVGRGGCVGCV